MRFSNLSKTASALALATALGACDDGLTEVNENPNGPRDVSVQFLLPQAQTNLVGRALGANVHMTMTSLFVQHLAKIQYADEDLYELRDGTINAHWNGFYTGGLEDLYVIEQKGLEAENENVVATSLVMQSWTFATMTDLWGDIPYSEALRGMEVLEGDTSVSTPKYDTQEEIYNGILADLTAASNMIDVAGNPWGNSDLIYRGNMDQWRLFANSLRMRYAMRLSEVDPAKARTEFVAAYEAGGFRNNADNALLVYSAQPDNNPVHENQRTRDDHAVSKTLVDTLQALDDPRLPVYAEPNATEGEYEGSPNGTEDVNPAAASRIGAYFVAANAPAVLMSYSEVKFLEAEAAARGWIPGDPAALYREAIRADMEVYAIPTAEINAYLAQPSVAFPIGAGLDAMLKKIALQKWIAFYSQGTEAFAEWRRLGYPVLEPGPDNSNDDMVPVRIPYPSSEQAFNNANLMEAVNRNGGLGIFEGLNDPVWWDK